MSRTIAVVAAVLLGSFPAWAQEKAGADRTSRVDQFGDELPAGALRRFGTVRFRQEYVRDMVFLHDGKSILVQSFDRVVQWDVDAGKALKAIPKSPLENCHVVAISRDGGLVAMCPDTNTLVVHELATGNERLRKRIQMQSPKGDFSPDLSLLAFGTGEFTFLIDLKTGDEVDRIRESGATKFSPDGKWLACTCRDGNGERLVLFDAKTAREPDEVKPLEAKGTQLEPIGTFAFTPDGKSLVVSRYRSGTLIYDVEKRAASHHLKMDAGVTAISSDSKILALVSYSDDRLILANAETGKEIRRWRVGEKLMPGSYSAFSSDSKILAVAFECGIQLWNTETGKRRDPYIGPVHSLDRVILSDDGKSLAAVFGRTGSQYLQLLNVDTLRESYRIDAVRSALGALAFSPDGRRLAFINTQAVGQSRSPSFRIVDVVAGKETTPDIDTVGTFSHWKGNNAIVATDVSRNSLPDWVTLDVTSGKELSRVPIPKQGVVYFDARHSVNERRKMVITRSVNGRPAERQLCLAEWPNGNVIRPFEFAPRGKNRFFDQRRIVGISPDERLILTTSFDEPKVTVTEAATGRERFQIESPKAGFHIGARFSADGRAIIVTDAGYYRFLDSLTFEPLLKIEQKTRYDRLLETSANGKILVTGEAAAFLVWDLGALLNARKLSAEKLTDARLAELWNALANDDAEVGYRALVTLSGRPEQAMALLKTRLPAPRPDAAAFQRLVRDLDDPRVETREAASSAIAKFGPNAAPHIREVLKNPPSIEAKRRLTTILEKLTPTVEDRCRWLRCAEFLERLDGPDARATLEQLRDVPDGETAGDVEMSLRRMAGRK